MSDRIFVTLSTFAEYDEAPRLRLEESGMPFSVNTSGKRITTGAAGCAGRGRHGDHRRRGALRRATVLARLPNLRCISRCGAGTDAIDLEEARRRGVAVLNTPDVPTEAVAELAMTMILALARRLRQQANLMGRREWKRLEGHLLAGAPRRPRRARADWPTGGRAAPAVPGRRRRGGSGRRPRVGRRTRRGPGFPRRAAGDERHRVDSRRAVGCQRATARHCRARADEARRRARQPRARRDGGRSPPCTRC